MSYSLESEFLNDWEIMYDSPTPDFVTDAIQNGEEDSYYFLREEDGEWNFISIVNYDNLTYATLYATVTYDGGNCTWIDDNSKVVKR